MTTADTLRWTLHTRSRAIPLRRRLRLIALIAVLSGGPQTPVLGQSVPSSPRPTVERLRAAEAAVRESELADARARGRAYQALAESLWMADRRDRVFWSSRQAIAFATEARDSVTIAAAQQRLGLMHWTENRYDSALVHLRASYAIRKRLNEPVALGSILNSIGATHYQWGNYEPALDAFVQALALRRDADDERGIAITLANIGKTYQDWGQLDRSLPPLEEAVRRARRLKDPFAVGYALHTMGMVKVDLGAFDEARQLFRESLAAYHSGDPSLTRSDSLSGTSLNTLGLGMMYLRMGKVDSSILTLRRARGVAESAASVRGQARALLYLGEAYRAAGDRRQATALLSRSLVLSRSVAQRQLTVSALAQLADLAEARGDAASALRYLRDYNALRDTIFNQSAAQRIAAMEARMEAERQQRENARLVEEQMAQAKVIARQRALAVPIISFLMLILAITGLLIHFNREGRAREALLAQVNADLRGALSEVKELKGLIPICANCKKIRDDRGYWEGVESYISQRSDASFSHTICSACGPEIYGTLWEGAPADEKRPETL